jgi:hypothetical protein
MYKLRRYYLCVAPDGRLEIWTHEENYMTGDRVWHLQADEEDYLELDLSQPPEFWGRESLGEWRE